MECGSSAPGFTVYAAATKFSSNLKSGSRAAALPKKTGPETSGARCLLRRRVKTQFLRTLAALNAGTDVLPKYKARIATLSFVAIAPGLE